MKRPFQKVVAFGALSLIGWAVPLFGEEALPELSDIVLPLPQYRNEPLTTPLPDPLPVPHMEARSPSLDKLFSDLSNTPLTDAYIEPHLRQEHHLWEDLPAEDHYSVEASGLMSLHFLLERAYTQNPKIKILQSQLNQAKMDWFGAKAMFLPTLKFDGSATLSSVPLVGPIDLHMGQFGSFPVPTVGTAFGVGNGIGAPAGSTGTGGTVALPPQEIRLFKGIPSAFYSFQFTLEQPIFTWGKLPMAVEAYKQALYAAELQLAKAKKEVRAEISISYQALYYIQKISKTIEQAQKIMDDLLTISNESYKTGFIIYNDYLDVQVKAQELIKSDYQVRDQYQQILIKLATLTGYEAITIDMIDFSAVDENWIPQLLSEAEYVSLALKNNLDLRLLKILKEANTLQAQIEKSSGYLKPDFGLQLSLGTMGPNFPFLQRGWYGHNNQHLLLSVGCKSTVVDGGTLLIGAMKKNEELNKTVYQTQLGEAEVRSFIAGQMSNLKLNRRNLEFLKVKRDSDKKLVDLRKIQFETGGSKIDYLRSQIEFNTGFADFYAERVALIQNYYMLMVAVGLL